MSVPAAVTEGGDRSHGKTSLPPLLPWLLVALLNFAAQVAMRWEFAPGEFGTANAILGVVGLVVAPAFALAHFLEQNQRPEALRLSEMLVLAWTFLGVILLFLSVPLLHLSRHSLDLFALLNLVVALSAVVGGTFVRGHRGMRKWAWMLVTAALFRLVAGAGLGWVAPWAEAGLAATLLASFVLVLPLLVTRDFDWTHYRTVYRTIDRAFWLHLGATVSVVVGIYLFTSVDRIFAQTNFGVPEKSHMGYVDLKVFDDYQAAGLLARALPWGTQPILAFLFLRRVTLLKTTARSLYPFWIYLAVLILGALLLGQLGKPLAEFFSHDRSDLTWNYLPAFALAMVPIGLLQGLGVFALASRRMPECFVLGACGVAYSGPLYFAGLQPGLMLAYMYGGAMISIMIVLFIGVVRWGRRQP